MYGSRCEALGTLSLNHPSFDYTHMRVWFCEHSLSLSLHPLLNEFCEHYTFCFFNMAMENDPLIDDFLLSDIVCLLVEWWFSKSQTVSHYQRVDTGPFTSSQDVNGLRRTCGQESPLIIPSAIFTLGCHEAWQLEPPCKLRFIAGKIIYTW